MYASRVPKESVEHILPPNTPHDLHEHTFRIVDT